MLTGLNLRVNVTFLEGAGRFILKAPYNADFIWALSANDIKRTWDREGKFWTIPSVHYDDVMKLLGDYFSLSLEKV